ncbi:hypothetical protein E4U19_007480 [Claviceps sp. Clav32 group G5]|nr:hypothetical protein E4U19_007480 [Claviceps sp. Clav32 group G5]
MPARSSRNYPWPVEGANVEDSEESSALQRNINGEVHPRALQSLHEAAFQAMGTPNNEFSNNAIGVSDELSRLWRGTFLENPPITIEQTIPEMSPAMQSPHEAAFQVMDTPMNGSSNNAIELSDEINQLWRDTFLENPPITIEQTIPGMSPTMQYPFAAAFQAMGTSNNDFSNSAIGVSDGIDQFWRGTFLENPPITIEQTIPEMSPAVQSPHEAAFRVMDTPMDGSSNNAIGVSDEINQLWRDTFLENPPMTIEETISGTSPAMQYPFAAAFQAMGTSNNDFSNSAIGVSDQFWRGTFLENPPITIEQTIPEMSPAVQSPHEAAFRVMDTPMNGSSNNAIGVSDEINQLWRDTFLENPPMTIEETISGISPAMQYPFAAAFQAMGTSNNDFSNSAIGVSDGIDQFWRGTFLENSPMTTEETSLEMSPAMKSPSEAASDASSVTLDHSIDVEVTTTNITFERVRELMERRRRQRRECVVAGIAEEDWNLDRLAYISPTRFTYEQWVQLLTEFSAEECQSLFVPEVAYWRAINSMGQTAPVRRED